MPEKNVIPVVYKGKDASINVLELTTDTGVIDAYSVDLPENTIPVIMKKVSGKWEMQNKAALPAETVALEGQIVGYILKNEEGGRESHG